MARRALDDAELERIETDTVREGPQARVLAELADQRAAPAAIATALVAVGLARNVADALQQHDATIDVVGSAEQQDLTRSVVEFRAGGAEQANVVGLVLGIHGPVRCVSRTSRRPRRPPSSSGSDRTAAGAESVVELEL